MSAVLLIRCTASAATSSGSDHAPDRQRGAQLLAARVEALAEQRRRQGRVDEAGRDEVDPDRRDLHGQVLDQRGCRGGERTDQREADAAAAAAGAADEQQRPSGPHHADGEAADAQRQQQVPLDVRLGPPRSPSRRAARSTGRRPRPSAWSIGLGRSSKKRSRRSVSVASNAAVLIAPTSRAARSRRSGLRPVRMTSAPSARARRAVSRPMPALPPMTTTVWPAGRGTGRSDCASGSTEPAACARTRSRHQRLERVHVDLREGREGLDGVDEDVKRDAGADGERGLLEPLARLRAERVGAGEALAVAQQGEEAVGFRVRARVGGRLGHPGHRSGRAEARLGGADRPGRPGRCRSRAGRRRSSPRAARRAGWRRRRGPGTCRRGSAGRCR